MDKVLLDKRINEILNKNGYIRVSELANEFNITESNMNYTLKNKDTGKKIFLFNYQKVILNVSKK